MAGGQIELVQAGSGDAGVSGKSTDNRPTLTEALAAVESGAAAALVGGQLDRLSRSRGRFGRLPVYPFVPPWWQPST